MAIMDRVRRGQFDLDGLPTDLRQVVAAALDPDPRNRPTLDAAARLAAPADHPPGRPAHRPADRRGARPVHRAARAGRPGRRGRRHRRLARPQHRGAAHAGAPARRRPRRLLRPAAGVVRRTVPPRHAARRPGAGGRRRVRGVPLDHDDAAAPPGLGAAQRVARRVRARPAPAVPRPASGTTACSCWSPRRGTWCSRSRAPCCSRCGASGSRSRPRWSATRSRPASTLSLFVCGVVLTVSLWLGSGRLPGARAGRPGGQPARRRPAALGGRGCSSSSRWPRSLGFRADLVGATWTPADGRPHAENPSPTTRRTWHA